MAAPNNAYNGRTLVDKKDNIIIHHQEANITDTIAILKERFYLDDVFINQKDGVSGFIGCCYASTPNYNMHATNRLGSLAKFRETVSGNGNWQSYRLFNDSGLNTLGNVLADMEVLNSSVGSLSVKVTFKSSYYNVTSKIGIGWKSGALKEGITEIPYSIPANSQQNLTKSVDTYTEVSAGTTLNVYATITNEEGTYISPYLATFKVMPAVWVSKYNSLWPSRAYNNGSNVTIYSELGGLSIGSKIFDGDNPISGANVTPGYYVVGEKWYLIEVNAQNDFTYITRAGECTPTGWPVGDPGRPIEGSTSYNIYFADDRSPLCAGGGIYRTIYKKLADNKYYTDVSLTVFVEYGYYQFPGEGAFTWRSTGNGLMTLKTACGSGGGGDV